MAKVYKYSPHAEFETIYEIADGSDKFKGKLFALSKYVDNFYLSDQDVFKNFVTLSFIDKEKASIYDEIVFKDYISFLDFINENNITEIHPATDYVKALISKMESQISEMKRLYNI